MSLSIYCKKCKGARRAAWMEVEIFEGEHMRYFGCTSCESPSLFMEQVMDALVFNIPAPVKDIDNTIEKIISKEDDS